VENMDRRNFLKTTSTVTRWCCTRKQSPGHRRSASRRIRSRRPPHPCYQPQLALQQVSCGGRHNPSFDDSNFERITVPHTNVRLPWHSFDEKTYEFVSLYRRRFKVPAEATGGTYSWISKES